MVSANGADVLRTRRGAQAACASCRARLGTRLYEQQMPPQLSDALQLVFVDSDGVAASPPAIRAIPHSTRSLTIWRRFVSISEWTKWV